MGCSEVEARLVEAALDRRPPGPSDQAHAASCVGCGGHARFLRELAAEFDRMAPPALPPVVGRVCRERAIRALRAQRTRRDLTPGFAWEMARALGASLLVLPAALAHAWLVAWGGSALLGPLLPEGALLWLGGVYFGSLALALGALFGAIPLAVALGRQPQTEPS